MLESPSIVGGKRLNKDKLMSIEPHVLAPDTKVKALTSDMQKLESQNRVFDKKIEDWYKNHAILQEI